MMAGAMATKTAHTGQSSGLTSHESRPLVVSNESGTCARGRAWRLPEGCREVCEATCREGRAERGRAERAPRAAWRLLAATPCGSGCTRGVRCTVQVQARCTRGAGAVQARWATHLERGDGHVGVALVLVLGRQPVVIAHVGHCAEEDHRGRRAVVRDEGADPPLKDAPTARACGAWGPLRRRLRRLDDPGLKAARLLRLEGPQQADPNPNPNPKPHPHPKPNPKPKPNPTQVGVPVSSRASHAVP